MLNPIAFSNTATSGNFDIFQNINIFPLSINYLGLRLNSSNNLRLLSFIGSENFTFGFVLIDFSLKNKVRFGDILSSSFITP